MEDLKGFLSGLRAFRDGLLRIAALPSKPNLNDEVILNAALFRLSKWAKGHRVRVEEAGRQGV